MQHSLVALESELKSLHQKIKKLEYELNHRERLVTKYDFQNAVAKGKVLFLGEGNMSFALSLMKGCINCHNVIVTTFESFEQLRPEAAANASLLSKLRVKLIYGVDGTKLSGFPDGYFDKIIFQFPYSRYQTKHIYNNCNATLIKEVLFTAIHKLASRGSLIITHLDNDYYNAVFNLQEAADKAGFGRIERFIFNPKDFPGYKHQMTYDAASGIIGHHKFVTWSLNL